MELLDSVDREGIKSWLTENVVASVLCLTRIISLMYHFLYTVGSRSSELQLSEHVVQPNSYELTCGRPAQFATPILIVNV